MVYLWKLTYISGHLESLNLMLLICEGTSGFRANRTKMTVLSYSSLCLQANNTHSNSSQGRCMLGTLSRILIWDVSTEINTEIVHIVIQTSNYRLIAGLYFSMEAHLCHKGWRSDVHTSIILAIFLIYIVKLLYIKLTRVSQLCP